MRTERKDRRTLWTNDLHNLFVATIDKLLLARLAITPKNIMRMMNDELKKLPSSIQLSRLQVASHLQQHREVMKKRELFTTQVHQLACTTSPTAHTPHTHPHTHTHNLIHPSPTSSGSNSPQYSHFQESYYELVQEELPPTTLVSSSDTNFVPASPSTFYYNTEVEVEAENDLDRYLNINLPTVDNYYDNNTTMVQSLPFDASWAQPSNWTSPATVAWQ